MRPDRREETGKAWDPRPGLFPVALEMLDDPTRHRAWDCGRGTSKSTTMVTALVLAALETPGCTVLYISDTTGRAKAVSWPHIMDLAEQTGGTVNLNDLTVTWGNKSRFFCTGADSPKIFNRKGRGIKNIKMVGLDECQDWKSEILQYAVTKVFTPRLGDLEAEHGIKGRIIMAGTGTVDIGYWHDVCMRPEMGFGVTRATQWDNPHIADPDGEFKAACKASGVEFIDLTEPIYSRANGRPRWVDCTDPMIRREFFAEFNSGGELQIFNVTDKNLCNREDLPTKDLRVVVCEDFGTIDAAAVGAWIFSPHDPNLYFVLSRKETGLSGTAQVRFGRAAAEETLQTYHPVTKPWFVGDGGGIGKALILDLQEAEQAWEVWPADKMDKVPNMRLMAGDIRDGKVKICRDLVSFLQDMKKPQWEPAHVGERIAGHVPDSVDCAYMGYRKVKELHRYVPPAVDRFAGLDQDVASDARREAERKKRAADAKRSREARY